MNSDEVIRKSDLARQLGLSKSRISQLIALGLPVRPDGLLLRSEAQEWLRRYHRRWGGGWGNGRRAQARLIQMATVNLAGMGMRDLPTVLGDYARLSDYHRGIVDFVNAQRRPKAREAVAWYCVLRGLRIEHAFHVTEVWDYILGTWMQDFIARCLDARRADVIYKFDTEPDWEMLARLSGEDCDVPKWRKEGKRAERKVSERLRSAT